MTAGAVGDGGFDAGSWRVRPRALGQATTFRRRISCQRRFQFHHRREPGRRRDGRSRLTEQARKRFIGELNAIVHQALAIAASRALSAAAVSPRPSRLLSAHAAAQRTPRRLRFPGFGGRHRRRLAGMAALPPGGSPHDRENADSPDQFKSWGWDAHMRFQLSYTRHQAGDPGARRTRAFQARSRAAIRRPPGPHPGALRPTTSTAPTAMSPPLVYVTTAWPRIQTLRRLGWISGARSSSPATRRCGAQTQVATTRRGGLHIYSDPAATAMGRRSLSYRRWRPERGIQRGLGDGYHIASRPHPAMARRDAPASHSPRQDHLHIPSCHAPGRRPAFPGHASGPVAPQGLAGGVADHLHVGRAAGPSSHPVRLGTERLYDVMP